MMSNFYYAESERSGILQKAEGTLNPFGLFFMLVAYKKSSIICQRENYILAKASVKILSAAKTANISGVNMNCIAVRNIARQKISAFVF